MAKDKGNFLRLEIFNKQPALINEAAIKFKIVNAVYFYAKKKKTTEQHNLLASVNLIIQSLRIVSKSKLI